MDNSALDGAWGLLTKELCSETPSAGALISASEYLRDAHRGTERIYSRYANDFARDIALWTVYWVNIKDRKDVLTEVLRQSGVELRNQAKNPEITALVNALRKSGTNGPSSKEDRSRVNRAAERIANLALVCKDQEVECKFAHTAEVIAVVKQERGWDGIIKAGKRIRDREAKLEKRKMEEQSTTSSAANAAAGKGEEELDDEDGVGRHGGIDGNDKDGGQDDVVIEQDQAEIPEHNPSDDPNARVAFDSHDEFKGFIEKAGRFVMTTEEGFMLTVKRDSSGRLLVIDSDWMGYDCYERLVAEYHLKP